MVFLNELKYVYCAIFIKPVYIFCFHRNPKWVKSEPAHLSMCRKTSKFIFLIWRDLWNKNFPCITIFKSEPSLPLHCKIFNQMVFPMGFLTIYYRTLQIWNTAPFPHQKTEYIRILLFLIFTPPPSKKIVTRLKNFFTLKQCNALNTTL